MIRDASPGDCEALSALAFSSKAHWGYDDAFMAACRDELTVLRTISDHGLWPRHRDRTVLLASEWITRDLGVARAIIKDEGRNVSGCLKDRATAVGVSLASEVGVAVGAAGVVGVCVGTTSRPAACDSATASST